MERGDENTMWGKEPVDRRISSEFIESVRYGSVLILSPLSTFHHERQAKIECAQLSETAVAGEGGATLGDQMGRCNGR